MTRSRIRPVFTVYTNLFVHANRVESWLLSVRSCTWINHTYGAGHSSRRYVIVLERKRRREDRCSPRPVFRFTSPRLALSSRLVGEYIECAIKFKARRRRRALHEMPGNGASRTARRDRPEGSVIIHILYCMYMDTYDYEGIYG